MKKEELKVLFKKYSEGTCTEQERALLEAWYLEFNEPGPAINNRKLEAAKRLIFLRLPGNEHNFPKLGLRLAAAAVIIGVLLGIIFMLSEPGKPKPGNRFEADLQPGTNKATLTLGTGQRIRLNDAAYGQLIARAGVSVTKSQAGQVVFALTASTNTDHSQNNISTPAGGQWQVQLADGTRVWLNAASKLSFPASFSGLKKRTVTLTGEGYFEVAKDPAHPFIVISGNQQVEVLGTHFNINCYADESAVRTTLIEGRVKVGLSGGSATILRPGEQAVNTTGNIKVNTVDTDEAVAWKTGYFQFDGEPVNSLMRKIARWYDVEVQYEGPVPTEGLNGKISRNKTINQVIKALEATKTVHFRMEGRRVIVMK